MRSSQKIYEVMIKYVVFDFDGTLVDSKAIFMELYNSMAREQGYTVMTPDNIDYLRTLSISARCRYLNIPLYKIPFMATKFIKQYKASVPLLQFNPGVEEMLSELSVQGTAYAVLSSNSVENIRAFFDLKELTVKDIFCSSNIFGKDKMLKKFLASKNLKTSEILYVGDEARDIIACNRLGIKIAWVSWGYDSPEAIKDHQPAYTVHKASDLLHLISGLSVA